MVNKLEASNLTIFRIPSSLLMDDYYSVVCGRFGCHSFSLRGQKPDFGAGKPV